MDAHAEGAVDREALPVRAKVATLLIQRMTCADAHTPITHFEEMLRWLLEIARGQECLFIP